MMSIDPLQIEPVSDPLPLYRYRDGLAAVDLLAVAITHLDLAWTIADTLNALMAIPNLVALLALSPVVVQLTRAGLARALQD